jgi:hypothetical protein
VESDPPPTRFLTVATVSEQRQPLVGFRASPSPAAEPPRGAADPTHGAADEAGAPAKRWELKLPLLRGRSALDKATRQERAEEKERQKRLESAEAVKETFFATPAGRARLAYGRGHRLFQYELDVNELSPTVIPGPAGSPARETTDPVDILNSVTVEGWKLVTGKFIQSEMRNGAVGVYLFKRSQKRRLAMNNPWQAPGATD